MPQKKPPSSHTDEIGALRASTDRQTKATEELSFVCAGMVSALKDMRVALHANATTNLELATASRALADELAALRTQRAKGGNGHAKDDHLIDEGTMP